MTILKINKVPLSVLSFWVNVSPQLNLYEAFAHREWQGDCLTSAQFYSFVGNGYCEFEMFGPVPA